MTRQKDVAREAGTLPGKQKQTATVAESSSAVHLTPWDDLLTDGRV